MVSFWFSFATSHNARADFLSRNSLGHVNEENRRGVGYEQTTRLDKKKKRVPFINLQLLALTVELHTGDYTD
jgi:hypothetical protein